MTENNIVSNDGAIGKFMQYCNNCDRETENILSLAIVQGGLLQLAFTCKKCNRIERYYGEPTEAFEQRNNAVKTTLEKMRSELVKKRPLMHVTQQDIGFDRGIQKAMQIIDKHTTQNKEL